MDKEESLQEAKRKDIEAHGNRGFCPLIRDECNVDCVCWIMATVHERASKEGEYVVRGGNGCCNQMFWRECSG